MGQMISRREVVVQSENVFKQFGDKWKLFAKYNFRLHMKNTNDLRNAGIGKFLVMAAMGPSLEEHIPTIKKYRNKFDLVTCDKGFGTLLEKGIKADYVMICDCNIPYRWFKNYVNESKGVKLLSTLYASPRWTTRWKGDKYFFVNMDAINSEKHFGPLLPSGGLRLIPAGSNVSNAIVIFFTGADGHQNINWGGYGKYFLVGYDYSWNHNGNYYAFSDPKPKRYYMNHKTCVGINGERVLTSENLFFSAKWMYTYISMHKLPVVNCSGHGLLDINNANFEEELKKINDDSVKQKMTRMFFDIAVNSKKTFDMASWSFEDSRRSLYARC